jgi:hypothetical protein
MDHALELQHQLQKILGMVSEEEKKKNKALERQTSRLIRAVLYLRALVPGQSKKTEARE